MGESILIVFEDGSSFISHGWLNVGYRMHERLQLGFGDVSYFIVLCS